MKQPQQQPLEGVEAVYKKIADMPSQEHQNELARDIFNFRQGWGAREALLQQERAAEECRAS